MTSRASVTINNVVADDSMFSISYSPKSRLNKTETRISPRPKRGAGSYYAKGSLSRFSPMCARRLYTADAALSPCISCRYTRL